MSGSEATFPIKIDSNAAQAGRDGAAALEDLRQRILGSTNAIREMQAAQSRLKGSTAEIIAAKAQLKSKIDAERTSLSQAQLALQRTGVSYEHLATEAKKAAAAEAELAKKIQAEATAAQKSVDPTKTAGSALKAMGGPVGSLPERFENLKKALGGMSSASGLASVAVVGLTVVVVALAAAAAAAAGALLKFIVEGANTARTARLTSEAMAGGAANAKALASQVDALASKVPQSRDELTKLADELALSGLRGDAFVDTLNAVAQTAGAVGEEAGNKLKTALEKANQGQLLTPKDFEGTGLDVAGVKLQDGAKAIRAAVEKQFGGINARKMLDLQVISVKFKDALSSLTRDVNLEPLLSFAKTIADMFDQSTVTGESLHQIVTAIGNGFSEAVGSATPFVKQILKGMVTAALQAGIAFFDLHRAFRTMFGEDTLKGVDGMKVALFAGKVVVDAIAFSLLAGYATIVLFVKAAEGIAQPFIKAGQVIATMADTIKKGDWQGLGKLIIDGLVHGLTLGTDTLVKTVTGLADKVKSAFSGPKGIDAHSPSKAFAKYGEYSAQGYAEGIRGGADDAAQAATAMVPAAPGASPAAAGGGAGAVSPSFNITIVAGGGAGGDKGDGGASKLQTPAFLAELQRAIEELLVREGIGVLT